MKQVKRSLFFFKFLRAGNSKVDKAVTAMMELIITLGKLADSEQILPILCADAGLGGHGEAVHTQKDTRETVGSQNRR